VLHGRKFAVLEPDKIKVSYFSQRCKNTKNKIQIMKNKYRAWMKEYRDFAIQGEPDFKSIKSFMRLYGHLDLEQFTGLIDENGKEIFEGDILIDEFNNTDGEPNHGYYEVVYDEKKACWAVDVSFKNDRGYLQPIYTFFGENLEVVGNIHQNKDLLCQ